MSILHQEVYLGDGLYASFDGYQVTLRAPRAEGDHYVCLEPEVWTKFVHYVNDVETAVQEEHEREGGAA